MSETGFIDLAYSPIPVNRLPILGGVNLFAQRIRKTLVTHMFPELENDCVKIIFGVATASGKEIESPADLLAAASDALEKAQEQKDSALTV